MKSPQFSLATGLAVCALFTSAASLAQSKEWIDVSVQDAVKQFNLLDPRHADLENRAAGILIFPQVTKGGIALAAGYGEGVLQIKGVTSGYYSLASASVGLTAGMATHSVIILFMTEEALDSFLKHRGWSVGADTSIAMIWKGAAGDYDIHQLRKPILGFVFGEQGLMADLSFGGSKINKIDK